MSYVGIYNSFNNYNIGPQFGGFCRPCVPPMPMPMPMPRPIGPVFGYCRPPVLIGGCCVNPWAVGAGIGLGMGLGMAMP